MKPRRFPSAAILSSLLLGAGTLHAAESFAEGEQAWRKNRDTRLRSENGWLTLVGLHWLAPGENKFGSDPSLPLPLPAGKAPAVAGALFLERGKVRVVPAEGVAILIDGKPAGARAIADDGEGKPDVVELGDLRFHVVKRGDRVGIRVRDPLSPVRTGFKGLAYFDPDPAYRVTATFEPYAEPRKIRIPTVLGTTEEMEAPGVVRFTLAGKDLSLEPVVEDPKEPMLFFIFKDATSRTETYPAGRFLYAEYPKDGKVVLNFNRAYNPPCAFTPYATCPLPPKQNWLDVRIEAGEKRFGGHE